MQLGPYVVEKTIGQGGMGAVMRVRHVETGGAYALKVILNASASKNIDRALGRFKREVEVLARIGGHPGIAAVHTCGRTERGLPWYVMDLVEGEPLSDRLRLGPLPPRDAGRLVVEIAEALAHVHAHRVLHRDLKPDNVILDGVTGRPKLVDFGLAYDVAADRLTLTGEIVGTPAFMAPEQCQSSTSGEDASEPDARTDVYGAGAVLYFALTGEPPFHGKEPMNLVFDVIQTPPVPPSRKNAAVPRELESICLRALEKEPADRYQTAADLAQDLERWLRGESTDAGRRGRARSKRGWLKGTAIATGVAAALVLAGASLIPGRRPTGRQDLIALEDALVTRGHLTSAEIDELGRIERAPAIASEPALARRAAILDSLARLTEPREAAAGASATIVVADRDAAHAIARQVRATGRVDAVLLRRVRRALVGADRYDALARVLFESPAVPPDPEDAARVATALAADADDAIPDDDAVFATLLAARIDEPTRGRLLALRGARALAQSEADGLDDSDRSALRARAQASLAAALSDHGAIFDASGWPESFHRHLHLAFEAALDERLDDAAGILGLLARAPDREIVPPAEVIGRLHRRLVFGGDATAVDPLTIRRGVLIGAYLDRHQAWISPPWELRNKSSEWVEEMERLAEIDARREADRRDPAVLVFLALVLENGTSDRPAVWIAAARETRVEAAWLHARVGMFANRQERWDAARRSYARAYELDRARPPGRRSPGTTKSYAERLLGVAKSDPSADLGHLVEVALQAAADQTAAAGWLREIGAAGGVPPWQLSNPSGIAASMRQVAEHLQERGPPHCCGPDGDVIERIVTAADALLSDELLGFKNTVSEDTVTDGALRGVVGLHHETHGRFRPALAEIERAVRAERDRTPLSEYAEANRRKSLISWLEHRARVLRALGETDRAKADEEEAAALREENDG